MTEAWNRAIALASVLVLAGCSADAETCPPSMPSGTIAYDRFTGERVIVTDGSMFSNFFSGRCSIRVEKSHGTAIVSAHRITLQQDASHD